MSNPLTYQKLMWPDVRFYDKERDVIMSVRDADCTVVPAGNMLGKDYVAGYISLSFFMAPYLYFSQEYVREVESRRNADNPSPHTVRVVTTSVKDDHLRVLWGEIGRFVQTCKYDLRAQRGGMLIPQHRNILKLAEPVAERRRCDISYLRGMVSERGEGLAGHHAAYTLIVGDEASGLDEMVFTQADTWAKRALYIGNPNPCQNMFRRWVREGDLVAK